jgi:hypothetical protein
MMADALRTLDTDTAKYKLFSAASVHIACESARVLLRRLRDWPVRAIRAKIDQAIDDGLWDLVGAARPYIPVWPREQLFKILLPGESGFVDTDVVRENKLRVRESEDWRQVEHELLELAEGQVVEPPVHPGRPEIHADRHVHRVAEVNAICEKKLLGKSPRLSKTELAEQREHLLGEYKDRNGIDTNRDICWAAHVKESKFKQWKNGTLKNGCAEDHRLLDLMLHDKPTKTDARPKGWH